MRALLHSPCGSARASSRSVPTIGWREAEASSCQRHPGVDLQHIQRRTPAQLQRVRRDDHGARTDSTRSAQEEREHGDGGRACAASAECSNLLVEGTGLIGVPGVCARLCGSLLTTQAGSEHSIDLVLEGRQRLGSPDAMSQRDGGAPANRNFLGHAGMKSAMKEREGEREAIIYLAYSVENKHDNALPFFGGYPILENNRNEIEMARQSKDRDTPLLHSCSSQPRSKSHLIRCINFFHNVYPGMNFSSLFIPSLSG